MEFRDNEAIYLQIAALVSENIMLGKWPAEQKIPSVRDLAVELEVNPNTVMRTYEFLQSQEVIYNKRGLGLFVAPDAYSKVKAYRKERFIQQDLPDFFRNIYLLDIDLEDMAQMYGRFKLDNFAKQSDKNNENKQ
jgi:GntR family transcriptional regulator